MKLSKDELAARDWWRYGMSYEKPYLPSREELARMAFVAGAQYARQADAAAEVAMAKKEESK